MFLRNCILEGSNLPLPCAAFISQKEDRNKIQNQAMCILTRAMCSTPISCLETITSLLPLEERCNIKVLTQEEKLKRLPNYPMNKIKKKKTCEKLPYKI